MHFAGCHFFAKNKKMLKQLLLRYSNLVDDDNKNDNMMWDKGITIKVIT